VVLGLFSSITWNTATGPTILSVALGVFVLTLLPWKKLLISKKEIKLMDK
tara:strand:+ start:236 stop:385 length:150 start_codon:yes stop_codon:yes gene_type:complete